MFNDIDAKRLKRLRSRMDEFIDATILWDNPRPWEEWYAWYPVKVHGKWTWLKKVYRREIPKTYVNHDDWTRHDYGTIFDVLNQ